MNGAAIEGIETENKSGEWAEEGKREVGGQADRVERVGREEKAEG